jgi:hypothetical protein
MRTASGSGHPSARACDGGGRLRGDHRVFFVVSLAFGSPQYAAFRLVVHLVAAVGLLVFWLHESHASDGKLLACFVAFESFAVVALILCATEQGKRPAQRRPLLNERA